MNVVNFGLVEGGIDWPAWLQAGGSVIAILVAVAVPAYQSWLQRRRDQSGDKAYALGAVVALEHAEAAISQVQTDLGGMRSVSRDQVAISPSLHMLEAVENALSSLAIDRAPNAEIARALMGARFHIRKVSGGIRAFLLSDNTICRAAYDQDEIEIGKAAKSLRIEARKLGCQPMQ